MPKQSLRIKRVKNKKKDTRKYAANFNQTMFTDLQIYISELVKANLGIDSNHFIARILTVLYEREMEKLINHMDFNGFLVPKTISDLIESKIRTFGRIGEHSSFGEIHIIIPGPLLVMKISKICKENRVDLINRTNCVLWQRDQEKGGRVSILSYPKTYKNKQTELFLPNYLVEPVFSYYLNQRMITQHTPCFMKTYGFMYSMASSHTIHTIEPLQTFVANNIESFAWHLLQLFQALHIAQIQYKYTHWDLHLGNVMLRKRQHAFVSYELNMDQYIINDNQEYDVVIIDYGSNRLETDDVLLTPRAGMISNKGENIVDHYSYHPFYDIYLFLISVVTRSKFSKSIKEFTLHLLARFLRVSTLESLREKLEYFNSSSYDNKYYRIRPKVLVKDEIPLTALEMCQIIGNELTKNHPLHFRESTRPREGFSDSIIYDLPKTDGQLLNVVYYPYKHMFNQPQIIADHLHCQKFEVVYPPLSRKLYNLSMKSESSSKQHIIFVSLPLQMGNKGEFRIECCKIDQRTYFQNPDIEYGVAINCTFFGVSNRENPANHLDFRPMGMFVKDGQNLGVTNEHSISYKDDYRAIIIDHNGRFHIIGLNEADEWLQRGYIKYAAVSGPILIEKHTNVFPESKIYEKNIDGTYKYLCSPPTQTYDNIKSCDRIYPGELTHGSNPNPRSALGIKDGRLYFISALGRSVETEGVDFVLFAQILENYHFETVLNLDGGRSSLITAKINNQIYISNEDHMDSYPVGNILSFCKWKI